MKTTTTIDDLIRTGAKRQGYDAFIDENGLIRTGSTRSNIMKQISDYTVFIKKVTDPEIFDNFCFENSSVDAFFKRAFLTRFESREIAFQTVDVFRNKLVSKMIINEQWLTEIYQHFDDIFNGLSTASQDATAHSLTETNNTTDTTTNHRDRNANVTLPQDNTNLSLENDFVDYADRTYFDNNRTIQNIVSHGTSETNSENHQNSVNNANKIEVIQALNNVYENKLREFDRALFLQIW